MGATSKGVARNLCRNAAEERRDATKRRRIDNTTLDTTPPCSPEVVPPRPSPVIKITPDKYSTYNSWINAPDISAEEITIRQSIIDQGSLIDGKLVIQGHLDLSDYTSLTSLPDNLTVNGDLNLVGCTSLTSLPDNLTVHGDLYLYGCTSLTSLPDNLTVDGFLNLRGCTSLTSLPEYIFSWNNTQRVIAEQTGIPPRILETYTQLQAATDYQGPRIEFTINDYRSETTVDASNLPALISQLSDSSSNSPSVPLNQLWHHASQQTAMNSPWNYLAIFLTRLLNETPRENNQIPKSLKDNLSQLFKNMESEYTPMSSDLASCDLINQTLSTATMAVQTCSDRVKVGYLYMQFFTKPSPKPYIDVLNSIQQFVNDVDEKKIIYHTTSKTFQNVHDVAKQDKFSDANTYLNPSEDSSLSDSVRYNLACTDIIDKDPNYQALTIGDPIEDILNLAYNHPEIPDNDIHKIDMKYRSCCSLNGDKLEAAIQYVQQHKLVLE